MLGNVIMKFEELNLNEQLLKGIHEAGFITCMPVQADTLVHTLQGKDAYVQSQTGTGKTAAFLVTIFHMFLEKDSPIKKKKALIIAPTRELAAQIEKDALQLGKYLDFNIACFYGGVGYDNQEDALEKGVDILIGTPGRLMDLQSRKRLDFDSVGILVIDEADRLFDMGFLPDIRKIVDSMSRRSKRLTMLFSATMDVRTRAIAREYMKSPVRIEIQAEQVTVDKVSQMLYHVAEKEKISLIMGIIKNEQPHNVLIFSNMKHTAAKVARRLEFNGFKCEFISGDLPQNRRLKIMEDFKAGQLPILVATDVAARGLHIEDLEMIINYDLPADCENYVHRIGRTARAGKTGKAISLACENYIYNLEAIETFIGMKIPVIYPEESLFFEDKSKHLDVGRPARRKERETGRGRKITKKPEKERTYRKKRTDEEKNRSDEKKKTSDYKTRKTEKETKPTEMKYKKEERKQVYRKDDRERKDEKKIERKKDQGDKDKKIRQDRKPYASKSKPSAPKGKKSGGLEDRLEYYKRKYGDNFKVTGDQPGDKRKPGMKTSVLQEKKSLIQRIFGIFKRDKNKK